MPAIVSVYHLQPLQKLFLLTLCIIFIVLVYMTYNRNIDTKFTVENNRLYHNSQPLNGENMEHSGVTEQLSVSGHNKGGKSDSLHTAEGNEKPHVIITFTNAANNYGLQEKFRITVKSLFRFSSVPINLYILGDEQSKTIVSDILRDVVTNPLDKMELLHLDINNLTKKVHNIVQEMQKHFSYKPGAYFSDALFFFSIASHVVLPDLDRVIMLDADLKFNADIKQLWNLFEKFSNKCIIGIARENQPVYRHTFHMYRNANIRTRVGDPPPDGLTGFNSGVLLLDLDKMRQSKVYNSVLKSGEIEKLTQKYMFKGHLGDQDFFTLLSMEYEDLFYVLPCTWNRQLCQWWKNHGYESVFDLYFRCEGHINIYHGNCNTPIPKLDWE
ncbi:hypothetical protein CHS0354_006171 [Potamilus streckersoni]|uniref:Xyloside xylosyltransferase 1 n=1 Tax=Potamilus streckersoni TaxID=2493646 RepID=A0AAE0STH1_9BIVA|nr:hypothetical protein CHS0354_006171 [Potamilus streckersoni]